MLYVRISEGGDGKGGSGGVVIFDVYRHCMVVGLCGVYIKHCVFFVYNGGFRSVDIK